MSDPHPRLRGDLSELPRYVAGVPPKRRGGVTAYKLSSNEMHLPPDEAVRRAASVALAEPNRYPDVGNSRLVGRLAAHTGFPESHIVVGGGSIAVLQQLVQAITDPGDAVVFAWRSYEAYPIVARVSRAAPTPVPLCGARHDLPAMARRVVEVDAPMVIVCNPNNPTGAAVTRDELLEFLKAVPPSCTVVLDEAYHEFVTDPEVPNGLDVARDWPNVVVLRTFSKAHALAGLRVGYAVCSPRVADAVRAVALPFTVSAVAEHAAVAALEQWPIQREVVADVVRHRDQFTTELASSGIDVVPSQANFVWLPLDEKTSRLALALPDAALSVRRFDNDGLRITIGEQEALDRVVHLIRDKHYVGTCSTKPEWRSGLP